MTARKGGFMQEGGEGRIKMQRGEKKIAIYEQKWPSAKPWTSV